MYVPQTKPFTSMLLKNTIDAFAKSYPLLGVTKIGTSRIGRPIYALTIGHGGRAVLINAAHHANEWITSVIAIKFLQECVMSSDTKWMDEVTLHIIPMVNPDGVDLVTGGLGRLRPVYQTAKKMAAENDIFPQCWKANILGIDLNSNYPANWDNARKSKYERGYTKPGPRDYVGEYPLCEPETSAMAAYTIVNEFSHTISLHTQGEEIYWLYQNYNPPRAKELALRLSAASGYKLEEVPDESSHAGYRDWFISKFNRPGMTIECGLGENPLPISDFDSIYKKVAPLLWECIFFRS